MASSRFDTPQRYAQFDVHHWADWVELCCLENFDGLVSREDIEKRYQRSTELRKRSEGKIDELDEDTNDRQQVDEEDADIVIDDRVTESVAKWFHHIKGRSTLFGAAYPFLVSEGSNTIQLVEQLSQAQRLYLVFLLMGNLNYFPVETAELTADFESLSKLAMKTLLPDRAEVHIFGKGSAASARYNGTAWERIQKLCADLRAKLEAKEGDFPVNSTGDAGLDLVGWLPWADNESSHLILFGQCACTPQWKTKQHSSCPRSWCSGKFHAKCDPINGIHSVFLA
jgi:hypothetical protein